MKSLIHLPGLRITVPERVYTSNNPPGPVSVEVPGPIRDILINPDSGPVLPSPFGHTAGYSPIYSPIDFPTRSEGLDFVDTTLANMEPHPWDPDPLDDFYIG